MSLLAPASCDQPLGIGGVAASTGLLGDLGSEQEGRNLEWVTEEGEPHENWRETPWQLKEG